MKNFIFIIVWETLIFFFSLSIAYAQSNPVPFILSTGSYSFTNWPSTSSAGTYPPNMIFHRGPSQDPALSAEPNADYTSAYNLTSGSRMNGLGSDGFSWRNTGTTGNLGAAVLSLNTIGMSTVRVSWTGGTVAVDATTREYRIRLQYRIDTVGAFTDVPGPIEYITNSTSGHSQTFGPTVLPPAVNNQPVVQLRWKYYSVGGSNTRPQLRIDDILVEANAGESSGDGTGTAKIFPDTIVGPAVTTISISYQRDTLFTVNGLRIIVPSVFNWSQDTSDVSFVNMAAEKRVSGDTITFSNISFSAESTHITINNIASPETTGVYTFKILTKENEFAEIAPQQIVVFGIPLPIVDMKANNANGVMLNLNKLITVRGIVTVANQFNGPSYIQDNSGGMAIFGSSFSTAVNIGDEVVVSGVVQPFNGLSEIVNPILHSIVSTGNVIEPEVVTAAQIANDGAGGVEVYEGRLVRLNGVTVTGTGNWSGQTNYPLSDPSGATEIRIAGATDLVGKPVPIGVFDLVAVVGQFKQTAPYIGGYQLMPRFTADVFSAGPIIESNPVETTIQPNSLTIYWKTVNNGTSRLLYGTTPSFELGLVENGDSASTEHEITISNLTPATMYYIKAFSVSGAETSFASTLVSITRSTSTGITNIYFNKSIDATVAQTETAKVANLSTVLLNRTNAAQHSIDFCTYSLSGTVGANIAQALLAAKNRGVKIRVIGEKDNQGTAPWSTLKNNGITVIDDGYDLINAGNGLMHNKFFVFDYRDKSSSEDDWVVMGSWNATDPGTNNDAQNVVEIQDQSLAAAYTLEFEEMWGSSADSPNQSNSRFGARKKDNTPHRFVIGGVSVESYFSPSDRVTTHINNALTTANTSINVAMLSFTRDELAQTLVAKKNTGKKVRVVVDNNTDSGNEFAYLQSNGIDIHLPGASLTGLLHHKYAVIDADSLSESNIVVTGSHNWSSSAENFNNENTLIIHSKRIANLYLQEFKARYIEAGGTDDITVGVKQVGKKIPHEFVLKQNYPNPFNPTTTIAYQLPVRSHVTLKVYDAIGREVATLVNEVKEAGSYDVKFDGNRLTSGIYFARLESNGKYAMKKLLLLK